MPRCCCYTNPPYISGFYKKISFKKLIVFAGIIVSVILPWTIYANHILDKAWGEHPLFILTLQGDRELLDSNNEYSGDGGWHTDWRSQAKSYYNSSSVADKPSIYKVLSFYLHHKNYIPHFLSAKFMSGLLVTVPQICLYISCFLFLIANRIKIKAFEAVSVCAVLVIMLAGKSAIETIQNSISVNSFFHYSLIILIVCTFIYYYKFQIKANRGDLYFSLLMLINFGLITLIFYGNPRITGVVDFICLIFTFYNLFELPFIKEKINKFYSVSHLYNC